MTMKKIVLDADPAARAAEFLIAYKEAPDGTSIRMLRGEREDHVNAIVIEIGDLSIHGFTVDETKTLIKVIESFLEEFPGSDAFGMEELARELQVSIEKAEAGIH